jgi:hypothetical protein
LICCKRSKRHQQAGEVGMVNMLLLTGFTTPLMGKGFA